MKVLSLLLREVSVEDVLHTIRKWDPTPLSAFAGFVAGSCSQLGVRDSRAGPKEPASTLRVCENQLHRPLHMHLSRCISRCTCFLLLHCFTTASSCLVIAEGAAFLPHATRALRGHHERGQRRQRAANSCCWQQYPFLSHNHTPFTCVIALTC